MLRHHLKSKGKQITIFAEGCSEKIWAHTRRNTYEGYNRSEGYKQQCRRRLLWVTIWTTIIYSARIGHYRNQYHLRPSIGNDINYIIDNVYTAVNSAWHMGSTQLLYLNIRRKNRQQKRRSNIKQWISTSESPHRLMSQKYTHGKNLPPNLLKFA